VEYEKSIHSIVVNYMSFLRNARTGFGQRKSAAPHFKIFFASAGQSTCRLWQSCLHERPSAREWFGITLVGVGVFILGFKR